MSDGFVRQKQADEVFCSSCGAIIKRIAEICPKCGVKQRMAPSNAAARKADMAETQPAPKTDPVKTQAVPKADPVKTQVVPSTDTPGLQEDEAFCFSCGAKIKKAAEICPKCGVRKRAAPSGTSGKQAGINLNKDIAGSVLGNINTAVDKIPDLNYIAWAIGIAGIVLILFGVIGIITSIPMLFLLFGGTGIETGIGAVTVIITGLGFLMTSLGILKIDKLLKTSENKAIPFSKQIIGGLVVVVLLTAIIGGVNAQSGGSQTTSERGSSRTNYNLKLPIAYWTVAGNPPLTADRLFMKNNLKNDGSTKTVLESTKVSSGMFTGNLLVYLDGKKAIRINISLKTDESGDFIDVTGITLTNLASGQKTELKYNGTIQSAGQLVGALDDIVDSYYDKEKLYAK